MLSKSSADTRKKYDGFHGFTPISRDSEELRPYSLSPEMGKDKLPLREDQCTSDLG